MAKQILFYEQQKFNQWWLWLILLLINGMFFIGIYMQLFLGEKFGNNPLSDAALLGITAFTLLLSIILLNLRLQTQIKNDGIYVRFFPFHFKFKYFPWSSLTKSYVRTYSPLSEYGGWGLRIGLFGRGTAYNVSGNRGLQLEFTNQKKLLIGTNKSEKVIEALSQIGQIKP